MEDVVELFGSNFTVTMETVFTTLEHTIRMLKVTGDNRAFKRTALREKRARLEQAIAVVLEESLAKKDDQGHSSLTPQHCDYHQKFVREILRPMDDIITFNYDCVIDHALKSFGDSKWNPRYGYGLFLGSQGHLLTGDDFWNPKTPAPKEKTVHLYKLHGSLNFYVKDDGEKPKVKLKERPYTKQHGNLKFTIIPPEWHKAYDKGFFSKLWKDAASAINSVEHIVFIGYSLPETDLHSTALFRTSLSSSGLKSLVVVNPDQPTRQRTRAVLQRGIVKTTRVLSFDSLKDFVFASRELWEI